MNISIYDQGDQYADRYSVIYHDFEYDNMMQCRGMSENPTHPQGFGQWFELPNTADRSILGQIINYDDLPSECQKLIQIDLNYFESNIN